MITLCVYVYVCLHVIECPFYLISGILYIMWYSIHKYHVQYLLSFYSVIASQNTHNWKWMATFKQQVYFDAA